MKSFVSVAPALPPPPYTSLTTTEPGTGPAGAVVNEALKFAAMVFGGSSVSRSVTWFAVTVTVQDEPAGRSTIGSSVKTVGPPLRVNAWLPTTEQVSAKAAAGAETGSLKVTVTFAPPPTSVAPFAGVVERTDGAASAVVPVTEILSTPIHSSEPGASVVIQRTCTMGWPAAAAGSGTLTEVTSSAAPAIDASATKAAGTFVYGPVVPIRYWSATGWT